MSQYRFIFFLLILLLGSGCSLTRSIPEGEYWYKKSKVQIQKSDKKIATTNLETTFQNVLKTPKPNRRILGVRWGLRIHNLFHTKKQKGLWHWLQKRLGEPPVLLDEQTVEQTKKLLANKAFNDGFFSVKVEADIKKRRKKAKVIYQVRVEPPYLITQIDNEIDNEAIKQQIEANWSASLLQLNKPFNLDLLKKERDRITTDLRQKGYYFFKSDFLKFKADTTQVENQVLLSLALKKEINPAELQIQTIQEILVFPTANKQDQAVKETKKITYEGLEIIGENDRFKPSVFRQSVVFNKGDIYSLSAHRRTLELLTALQNFQFTDIQFYPAKDAANALRAVIQCTPRKQHVVEGSVGLSLKSSVYIGPELALSYINRNLFGGAEELRFNVSGNYNYPLIEDLGSYQEQDFSLELSKPGLIVPFRKKGFSKQRIAKSKAKIGWTNERFQVPLRGEGLADTLRNSGLPNLADQVVIDSTYSPFAGLNNLTFSLTYQWQDQKHIQKEFTPIDITWQSPRYEIEELRTLLLLVSLLDDSYQGLQLNLEKMLIYKPSYVYLIDSRLKQLKTHNFRYRTKLALAGNWLLRESDIIPKRFLQSQFAQIEQDFRYYWQIHPKHTIATRLAFNAFVPFQNEVLLPFFELYEIGGPNSVRAFQPRAVGPGSTPPSEQVYFFSGKGDVLLESSLEWRPKLTDLIELGLFLDAGNVWLFRGGINNNTETTFQISNFYKQLAIGTGMGIRLDFDILLLRFDVAFPLTKPWLPEGERWIGNQIDFGSRTWRRDNLLLQLNFGYSF